MLLAAAIALGSAWATYALGARVVGGAERPAASTTLEAGKRLYRKYCGQCHALREARAAGFGSKPALGTDGGPNFNNLRVPYSLSILLMTQASNGHERIFHKLKWTEIKQVATFVDDATKDHAVLARPTDG